MENYRNNNIKIRDKRIDALKGIAIFAIVLYHLGSGILPYGYLGVEIFFVISGFLMMKSILKSMEQKKFNYWDFISKKILRIMPMVLIIILISLFIGYFTLLPDSFKIIGEHGVATSIFADNILNILISQNYWALTNSLNPLMHMWYIGILLQAFILIAFIYNLVFKLSKNKIKYVKITSIILTLISFCLYLMPFNISAKFYGLHFRIFEITIGCIVAAYPLKIVNNFNKIKQIKILDVLVVLILLLLIFVDNDFISSSIKLILVVIFTAVLLLNFNRTSCDFNFPVLADVGKCSYSIYICHQVIIAFFLSLVSTIKNTQQFMMAFLIIIILSAIVYFFIEKPLNKIIYKYKKKTFLAYVFMTIIVSFTCINIYMTSGVVRDIPELNVQKSDFSLINSKKNILNFCIHM